MQTTAGTRSEHRPNRSADDASDDAIAGEGGRWNGDHAPPLHAYPTLRAAAGMLGVAASTLSRRKDLRRLRRGERDQALAPAEVLRLAAIYRRRSLNEIASELIELAASLGGVADADRVEHEVDGFFTGHERHEPNDEWFDVAERLLPQELYEQVAQAIHEASGRRPAAIVGHLPSPTGRRGSLRKTPAQVRS